MVAVLSYTGFLSISTIFWNVKMGNTEVNIDELQTFVEVAYAGGISPAAQRLGVSKSIVSRRLAHLVKSRWCQLSCQSGIASPMNILPPERLFQL